MNYINSFPKTSNLVLEGKALPRVSRADYEKVLNEREALRAKVAKLESPKNQKHAMKSVVFGQEIGQKRVIHEIAKAAAELEQSTEELQEVANADFSSENVIKDEPDSDIIQVSGSSGDPLNSVVKAKKKESAKKQKVEKKD